eukprot:TRINITY_DN35544_c0_g1_i1.p1 TRINITY_DN35544_c0_g1~~TRINITY_DN35544_c0_g1_i1.p1  ORF type:complete len:475 (+),score=130.01 TRINITY_DN35544_c0_g1_i1:78-1427(+)
MLLTALAAAAAFAAPRVAVIGGGFAGTSTAWYLNKLCPGCYNVTIFEGMDRLGGRVKHVQIPGTEYKVNVGGDAYSIVNEYVMDIVKDLGIQPSSDAGSVPTRSIGLWKGPGNGWEPLPFRDPALLWDGLVGLLEIARIRETLTANYKERGNLTHGTVFETLGEFAAAGGLNKFTARSMKSLMDELKVSADFQQGFLEPMTRDIYDQSLELNAFAGMVTVLSGATATYSAKGGNDEIPKALAAASGADVQLSSPVEAVELTADGKFTVTAAGKAMPGWDWVVLASPIESNGADGTLKPIQWKGFDMPALKPRPYRHWYDIWTLAKAPSPTAFEHDGPVPDLVLTPAGSTAPLVKLGAELSAANGTLTAYKIFANDPVSNLSTRFEGLHWSHTQHWPKTFPDLAPVTEYQPLRLHPRILYPNAMESIAVAMETACIAGRNAAQMIHRGTA